MSLHKTSPKIIQNCYNWNSYPNLEHHHAILSILDAYDLNGNQRMRIHSYVNSAINDAMVITWFYKFLYEIPRPNQLDQKLATLICTPSHPTYPGGHAVIGSTITELLTLLFPVAKAQLDSLLDDSKRARFTSGVHYEVDNQNGEVLGRKIGSYIYNIMKDEKDENGNPIDVYKRGDNRMILRVEKRRDINIFTCKSLIDKRSFIYNKKEF